MRACCSENSPQGLYVCLYFSLAFHKISTLKLGSLLVHVRLRLRTFSQNLKILKKDDVRLDMSTGRLSSKTWSASRMFVGAEICLLKFLQSS
jgi:hypothetical protein